MKALAVLFPALVLAAGTLAADPGDPFKANLDADACRDFATEGKGLFYDLRPGSQLVLEGREDGKGTHLVLTVTGKTKKVAGVDTRVMEERESADGDLKEVSLNYVAICKSTGDLCYFGEDVDEYDHGKLTGHGSSWLEIGRAHV